MLPIELQIVAAGRQFKNPRVCKREASAGKVLEVVTQCPRDSCGLQLQALDKQFSNQAEKYREVYCQ